MQQAFDVQTTIDQPIDKAWDALTDWSDAPQWMKGVDSLTANGPTEPGTALTFRARGKDRSSEIVTVDPGRSVTLRSRQGGVTADYRYTLTAVDDTTTTARLVAGCETDGFLWNLIGPVLRLMMSRTDRDQMDAFKVYAESV